MVDETTINENEVRTKLKRAKFWKWFAGVGLVCALYLSVKAAWEPNMAKVFIWGTCLALNAFNMKMWKHIEVMYKAQLALLTLDKQLTEIINGKP